MEDVHQLRERVAIFPRWHYEFDLNGVRTPIFNHRHVNRHEQRKNYFFRPLVRLCGGSLSGKRVLDLGCNAGFWSLMAIEAGADYVSASTAVKCTSTRQTSCSRRRASSPAAIGSSCRTSSRSTCRGRPVRHRSMPRPPLPREQPLRAHGADIGLERESPRDRHDARPSPGPVLSDTAPVRR